MRPDANLYIGRSGELRVLSEILSRGYNAASPEVDRGEDIFVIEDGKQNYWPVQVKTANGTEQSDGRCTAQFRFRRDQLVRPTANELTYVLTLRRSKQWVSFLVIPRSELYELYRSDQLGRQEGEYLIWTFIYSGDQVHCQNSDLTRFESAWDMLWPDLL